jgi:hypothetical protein
MVSVGKKRSYPLKNQTTTAIVPAIITTNVVLFINELIIFLFLIKKKRLNLKNEI